MSGEPHHLNKPGLGHAWSLNFAKRSLLKINARVLITRARWLVMAIYRLIAKGSFGPEEIERLTAAYEAALLDLGLRDRDDPVIELVAEAIIGIADRGECDPAVIKNRALQAIGARTI